MPQLTGPEDGSTVAEVFHWFHCHAGVAMRGVSTPYLTLLSCSYRRIAAVEVCGGGIICLMRLVEVCGGGFISSVNSKKLMLS